MMLAAVFSTADYHALARAWPLHGVVAWGLVLPTLFLHNVNTGLLTIGYDAGGTSNYSWYRVGGMTFQPAELAKISFILTLALHLSRVRGQVNRPRNLLLVLLHILLVCGQLLTVCHVPVHVLRGRIQAARLRLICQIVDRGNLLVNIQILILEILLV